MPENHRIKLPADAMALDFDRSQGGSLADQLHRRLRDALLTGRFAAGAKLPSTRSLAAQLGVSRNTVLEVYERLLGESYLSGRRGSGTYVSENLPRQRAASVVGSTGRGSRPTPGPLAGSGFSLPAMPVGRDLASDFRPGLPDLRRFPLAEWRRSALRRLRSHTLLSRGGSDDALGDRSLRAAIAEYVSASRAALCGEDQIMVTSGAQQAFSLLAQVLLAPDRAVAVEDPGYPPAIAAFARTGARIACVPVDPQGLQVSALPADAAVVYTTPSHQFPLGVSMSLRRRQALLEWAHTTGAWIIEDDYDSEFRFGGRRVESLKSLDCDGRVIYVGTFSKVLLPTIRLGYVALPDPLIEPMRRAKWLADRHTASLPQAVMAEFMQTGGFARHLRRMNTLYEERFAALTASLANLDPAQGYLVPSNSGLHVTLLLPPTRDVPVLIDEAAKRGIGLHGLDMFCREHAFNGLTLGFGNVETALVARGSRELRDLLQGDRRHARRPGGPVRPR